MLIVTGGAGFIGSGLIAALNARGLDDILVVDELGKDNRWKNLCGLSFSDYIEKDDFLELVKGRRITGPIEAVFHMGACSSTTETNAAFLVKNNYEYTKVLALYAIEKKIRFIYASSAATYGDGSAGFKDDQDKIETLRPLNMYACSKQMFDVWALKKGFFDKIAGLKYFNVFGPNEYHKGAMRSFVLKAFEQINSEGKVKLFKSYNPQYKDGDQIRDFIYIKDALAMTLFFMDNPNINGLFNIGTGLGRSWNDLANAVFAAMEKEVQIEYIEMPQELRGKYQYFTQADISKIRKAGWSKKTISLEDSIKDYVQNYLQKQAYLIDV